MDYDAKNDVFYCHNHRKLTCVGKKTATSILKYAKAIMSVRIVRLSL